MVFWSTKKKVEQRDAGSLVREDSPTLHEGLNEISDDDAYDTKPVMEDKGRDIMLGQATYKSFLFRHGN
jgi:hypothetical protein